jgi:hypothetical protein
MQRLEVSCAVRHIYIYVVSRLRVNILQVIVRIARYICIQKALVSNTGQMQRLP